jgi:hypothetical protein
MFTKMKNLQTKLISVSFLLTFCLGLLAQTTIYQNFDSFNSDEYVVEQAIAIGDTHWQTWSGDTAEDALVSADYSMTPSNSMVIKSKDDVVFYPGSYTSGKWFFSGHIYVVSGHTAYFNMMHNWADYNYEWACQVFFRANGTGFLNVGSQNFNFTYNQDTWLYFSMKIDLTNDNATFWVNDQQIHQWPWHYQPYSTSGQNKFEAVDFYGWDDGGATSLYYVDEVTVSTNAIIRFENKVTTWDGSNKQITVKTYPPNLSYDITYDGDTILPVEPGIYSVEATITDPQYSGNASGSFTIEKATASIAISNTEFTYDGTPKSITPTTTPSGLNVDVTYNGSPTLPVNTGEYLVLASINDAHYSGSSTDTLVITKATAIVTISDNNVIYNSNPQAITTSTNPAGLSVDITYDGNPTAPANVGKYVVDAVINDINFEGSVTDTLTINKATATISFSGTDVVYDGNPKPVTYETTPSDLTANLTYDSSAIPPVNAGSYLIIATVIDANYQATVSDTLLINKANTLIIITDTIATFDNTAKAVSVETTPAGLNVEVTYDNSPTVPINAGEYQVLVTVIEPNYQGTETGILTINKADAIVSITVENSVYDSTEKTASVETIPAGLTFEITYNGSTSNPVNAGSYTIVATITDLNYQGSSTDTLIVEKANAEIEIYGTETVYDGSVKSVNVLTNPSGLPVEITYNGNIALPVDAGEYIVAVNATDPNYNVFVADTLIINKADQVIYWDQDLADLSIDESVELDANTSSGLEVIYSSDNQHVAQISGSVLKVIGAGTANITATQAGNQNFNVAPAVENKASVNTTSISQPETVEIKCWPNPVVDKLFIGLVTDESIEIQIFNQAGSHVSNITVSGYRPLIDFSGIPSGTYMIRFNYQDVLRTIKVLKTD